MHNLVALIDASLYERATAQRDQTATEIPLAQARADTAQYQMERLLGKAPGELAPVLASMSAMPVSAPDPKALAEISLDRVRARPDIAAARANLLAAQAGEREAEANLWPRLTLSGFFGLQEISGNAPFAPSNPVWSLASSLSAPILNFGRLRGQVNAADARSKQAELTYENTVLLALQETKTAMSDYVNGFNAASQQQKALEHRQQAVGLARTRFERGLTDMTDLTTAQTELDQATLLWIERRAFAATAFIRLQKALGTSVSDR